jgi:hypothetical protein
VAHGSCFPFHAFFVQENNVQIKHWQKKVFLLLLLLLLLLILLRLPSVPSVSARFRSDAPF